MATPIVYVDMDGVLANFTKAYVEFTGVPESKWITITRNDWQRLQQDWSTFWSDLEPMPFALELWRVVQPYHPCILTATPPSWPSASVGKRIWCRRVLPKFGYSPAQQFHAVQRKDKQKFARQADGTPNVLIDDHRPNIDEWTAAGGHGVIYIPSSAMVQSIRGRLARLFDEGA
jgi:hypothetical protein